MASSYCAPDWTTLRQGDCEEKAQKFAPTSALDSQHVSHPYDRVSISTGSRAASSAQPVLQAPMTDVEVSVVMPCLNEAETLGACIEKAQRALHTAGISGEVIVADN